MQPLLRVLAVFAAALILLACSGDDGSLPSSPSPSPEPEASPTTPPRQGPQADGPTGPGPRPGASCPVDPAACEFARRLLPLVQSGDLDGLIALAEPVAATCGGNPGFGGPSAALCAAAAPGEVRSGYWDVQAGEGLVVTESEWRRTLTRWLASIRSAQGSDVYGDGALKIGSISCARFEGQPAGVCDTGTVRVHLTFINAHDADPASGTGLPGQRTSFHFTLHRNQSGELRIEGSGTVVPPNTVLLGFEIEGIDQAGRKVVIQHYPWTP
jgi:hypothetical protein